MKKFAIIAMLSSALLWMGCPVGLDYPLAEPGSHKIDKNLIGTWSNGNSEEAVQTVEITERDKNSYDVEVLERGELYSLETNLLIGYVTQVNGKMFCYFQPEGEEKFYHYQYSIDGNTLTTVDMALLDGGMDAVTSTETLQKQVSKSMKHEDWGKEPLNWEKQ